MNVLLLARFRGYALSAAVFACVFFVNASPAHAVASYVSMSAIDWQTGTSDYGYGNGINTISFRNNAIYTVGNYQFVSYYDAAGKVCVARRNLTTDTWEGVETSLTSNSLTDDHDVISFGIDGNGYLHLSWGMHNNALNYAISSTSVLGTSFGVTFSSTSVSSVSSTSVTYPEFYNLADGDLILVYRNGASGDGDSLYTRYDSATKTWSTSTLLTDGTTGSYNSNAYANNMVITSSGSVYMSWTWRETSYWQTNHGIYCLTTSLGSMSSVWKTMSGSSVKIPITQAATAALAVSIAQTSSLINQTSMTLDQNNNPLIATYWAPDGATRQYMLVWWDSTAKAWQTSQISNRPTESAVLSDNSTLIRQMGRPIVLVDQDGRVIVITRSNDKNNYINAYYSSDRVNWSSTYLLETDTGRYEPNYDETMWSTYGILSLYYEGAYSDSSGNLTNGAQQAYVLEWDATHYLRENITCSFTGASSDWGNKSNWSNVATKTADGVWTTVQFGYQPAAYATVDLGTSARTVGKIYFAGTTSTTIASTAGYALTLNNSGTYSKITVSGTHQINVPVILANALQLSAASKSNLTFAKGLTGDYAVTITGSGVVNASTISVRSIATGYRGVLNATSLIADSLSTSYAGTTTATTASFATVTTIQNSTINISSLNVSGTMTLAATASLNVGTASIGVLTADYCTTIVANTLSISSDLTIGDTSTITADTLTAGGTITVVGSSVIQVGCLVADSLVLGGEISTAAATALASANELSAESVPEPATLAVVLTAVPIGLALAKRRRRRHN